QRKRELTGSVVSVRGEAIMPMNNLMAKLEGKVAGVQIVQNANPGAAADIRIRGAGTLPGANEPLLIVNGVPAGKFDLNLNANDVESIDVLKDATATAIYGSRAANGVIVITSKKYRNERIRVNLSKEFFYATQPVQSSGAAYTVARKFYAPKYTSLVTEERDDFRETIYWNPVVQTDKDGKAIIEFYNSDASTTFRAIAEGIGYNGKPGRAEATYAVQNAMTVDAKIPPYLTVGDKALIPVVIKNNTLSNFTASINLFLPPNMKGGDYTRRISLAPDSSRQVLIPVEATSPAKAVIRFVVSGPFSKETISLPVSAADKGFPVIGTVSGNKSGNHHFTLNQMVPGSLKTELKVFKSIEGQLLDGIESMLREPYGCFEQTSSTTYPNIFVLKYLRESGKSNPDIEKKALGYISAGYERLISFETQENGFEWFGHTPAHEALTAYGLLEFTDMQEFVNVDIAMLERTKKFLLARRDGNGSFRLASGGYDRFASVPNKIANVYIVYALSRAGLGKEIQPEYAMAVTRAVESNDAYQLAMMALAAAYMKNEKDFSKLMSLLNENYQKYNLRCETSVVNSRDASLRVESMSLYALALMKEKSPDVGLVAGIVSKILGEKNYYGYGSTQATVLALQAIVEYSKLAGKMTADSELTFKMNQKIVTPGDGSASAIMEGENSFDIHYSNAKTTIPYNLEYSYNTLTPPNSPKAELKLRVQLDNASTRVGETIRMTIEVKNEKAGLQPMAIAKIGIPAGLSAQPWQLKEIMEKNQAAYYEIFDNYLVFYWMGFAQDETKVINLDLKSEIPGTYKARASNVYLYYTPEHKHWNAGAEIEVIP
ncbi:MAG TPA: TonB-dependent receptor plug domain-containing protein, partial [Chitinophagaceae bacterium]|nr:TonB-dependent receptor plug domain-containing protein [Chitinophagaceae bacterium]